MTYPQCLICVKGTPGPGPCTAPASLMLCKFTGINHTQHSGLPGYPALQLAFVQDYSYPNHRELRMFGKCRDRCGTKLWLHQATSFPAFPGDLNNNQQALPSPPSQSPTSLPLTHTCAINTKYTAICQYIAATQHVMQLTPQ